MKKGQRPTCKNHPDRKVLGSCHACHDWLCRQCLQEGLQHYFCYKTNCIRAFRGEVQSNFALKSCKSCGKKIKKNIRFCPGCGYRLQRVTEEEVDDLVTIAHFGIPLEAHLARTKLESENVESYVTDEHLISLYPYYDIGLGGVKLKTRRTEAETALQILDNPGSIWKPSQLAAIVYMLPEVTVGLVVFLIMLLIAAFSKIIYWLVYIWQPL